MELVCFPYCLTIQDLFHVFLNNFEIVIFLLFFKLFIVFFLHYVSVIFKKRKSLIKLVFTAFVCFKLRCKMSGVILNGAKKAFERGAIKKCAMIVSYEQTGFFFFKL